MTGQDPRIVYVPPVHCVHDLPGWKRYRRGTRAKCDKCGRVFEHDGRGWRPGGPPPPPKPPSVTITPTLQETDRLRRTLRQRLARAFWR